MAKKKAISEAENLKLQLARALADYDNLKKRSQREKEEITRYANQRLVEKLLPVVVLINKVREHTNDPAVDLVVTQLSSILDESGVLEIKPTVGEVFNEELHEAADIVEDGKQGTVAEILEEGFAWEDGRLIKPAQVKVYGKLEKQKEELKKEMLRGDYV